MGGDPNERWGKRSEACVGRSTHSFTCSHTPHTKHRAAPSTRATTSPWSSHQPPVRTTLVTLVDTTKSTT